LLKRRSRRRRQGWVNRRYASLIHGQSHPATTRGHTLGAPRLYDILANVFFVGRRRATFQALITAAGVRPGQRVLEVVPPEGQAFNLRTTHGPSVAMAGALQILPADCIPTPPAQLIKHRPDINASVVD